MNKKAETNILAWIFGILFFVIVIGVGITVIMVSNQESKKELIGDNIMDFYLIGKDYDSKKSVEIDYNLNYNLTKENIESGILLRDSYTEFKNISNNDSLKIYCGGRGYYFSEIEKIYTPKEIEFNSSKQDCLVKKIGNIKIGHIGELKEGEEVITLNITSESYYQNIGICVAWTPGIITITSDFEKIEKPERIEKIVDKCFYTNVSLKDNFESFNFRVKSDRITSIDKVTFYVFDGDLHYNPKSKEWEIFSEFDGVNLGSNLDKIYEVVNGL